MAGLPGLIIYAGTVFTAGCIGVFLVYLQHNFEDTWWDRKPDLNPARAALQGSSALDLGWWWDLGTGNIAYHDIHHFNANIPSYRLRKCHRALREKYEVQTIRWPEAIRSFTLKLWDEDQERLVPFPRARRSAWSRPTPDPTGQTCPFILAKNSRRRLPSPATGSAPDGLAHHVPIGLLHRAPIEPPAFPEPRGHPVSIAISAMVASFVSGTAKSRRPPAPPSIPPRAGPRNRARSASITAKFSGVRLRNSM
jgi:hypothetical protein